MDNYIICNEKAYFFPIYATNIDMIAFKLRNKNRFINYPCQLINYIFLFGGKRNNFRNDKFLDWT
jgi:hypothetical protein